MRKPAATDCKTCFSFGFGFCVDVGDALLNAVRKASTEVYLCKGSAIDYENHPTNAMFIVTKGEFKAIRTLGDGRRQIIGFASEGDILGSPYFGVRLNCSFVALTGSVLCKIRHDALSTILEDRMDLNQVFLATVTNEVMRRGDHTLLLGQKKAEERLAYFLIERARTGRQLATGKTMPSSTVLTMPRRDIAAYLGLTTETVSRMMSQLKRRGLIRPAQNSRIMQLDVHGLRHIAGNDFLLPCGPRMFL